MALYCRPTFSHANLVLNHRVGLRAAHVPDTNLIAFKLTPLEVSPGVAQLGARRSKESTKHPLQG